MIKKNIKEKCLNNNINDPYLNLSNSQYTNLCKITTKYFLILIYIQTIMICFYNKNLERQFYTMPNIFNPSYNKDISNWLYNTIDNCKNNSIFVPYKNSVSLKYSKDFQLPDNKQKSSFYPQSSFELTK